MKRKKLAILGLIIMVAVAAGVAAWLLVDKNSEAKAKDYTSAQKAITEVRKSYEALEKSFNAYADKPAPDNAMKEAYDKALADYRTKLGATEKAVDKINDSKVTDAHEAFKKQSNAFMDYSFGYTRDYSEAVKLSKAQCVAGNPMAGLTGGGSIADNFTRLINDCKPSIDKLKASSSAGLSAYGASVEKFLNDRKQGLTQAPAGAASSPKDIQQALAKLLSTAPPNLTETLAKSRNEITVMSSLDKLNNIVAEEVGKQMQANK